MCYLSCVLPWLVVSDIGPLMLRWTVEPTLRPRNQHKAEEFNDSIRQFWILNCDFSAFCNSPLKSLCTVHYPATVLNCVTVGTLFQASCFTTPFSAMMSMGVSIPAFSSVSDTWSSWDDAVLCGSVVYNVRQLSSLHRGVSGWYCW